MKSELAAWLDSMLFTAPLTLSDMREFHTMLKTITRERAVVDICTRDWKHVDVVIEYDGSRFTRRYAAT